MKRKDKAQADYDRGDKNIHHRVFFAWIIWNVPGVFKTLRRTA